MQIIPGLRGSRYPLLTSVSVDGIFVSSVTPDMMLASMFESLLVNKPEAHRLG